MAFISSPKNSSGKEEVNTASIPTASTQVSPGSANVAAASIGHDTVYAYIASQSNGSQVKYEDINQIDEDDIEEMNIKWNMALLSMRADRFWKKTRKNITIQGTDFSEIETVHGELSRVTRVLAGGSRHSGSADEATPQRHRSLRHRVRRRRCQPSAPAPLLDTRE
nr:hypothetical protein [Tanacetum cinerariifolium]